MLVMLSAFTNESRKLIHRFNAAYKNLGELVFDLYFYSVSIRVLMLSKLWMICEDVFSPVPYKRKHHFQNLSQQMTYLWNISQKNERKNTIPEHVKETENIACIILASMDTFWNLLCNKKKT